MEKCPLYLFYQSEIKVQTKNGKRQKKPVR